MFRASATPLRCAPVIVWRDVRVRLAFRPTLASPRLQRWNGGNRPRMRQLMKAASLAPQFDTRICLCCSANLLDQLGRVFKGSSDYKYPYFRTLGDDGDGAEGPCPCVCRGPPYLIATACTAFGGLATAGSRCSDALACPKTGVVFAYVWYCRKGRQIHCLLAGGACQ
jgi:hypothetical protein